MRRTITIVAAACTLGVGLSACGGSDEASDCSPATSGLTVEAQDSLLFDATSYEVEAGCIDVTYVNDGGIPHTLLVEGRSGFKLAVGDTDRGTIDLPPGTYTLICDVAGHRSAGMEAELVTT
jgi:plastocyanin